MPIDIYSYIYTPIDIPTHTLSRAFEMILTNRWRLQASGHTYSYSTYIHTVEDRLYKQHLHTAVEEITCTFLAFTSAATTTTAAAAVVVELSSPCLYRPVVVLTFRSSKHTRCTHHTYY